jgi:threonyl-tRNA synthetase
MSKPSIADKLNQSETYTPLQRMRHSAAHVMAEAVQALYPGARFAIGPAIEDGFYYDLELPRPLTPDDLPAIEARMRESVAADHPFVHGEWPRAKALAYFRERDQPYKVELIEGLPGATVGIEEQGPFLDLCRGQHVARTGEIGPFKLLRLAGAYWRGDEHRPMLQRLYGTAWPTQAELDAYLERLEEAKRRDHRRLGRDLDLFSISPAVGPGLILWHPRGAMIRVVAEDYYRQAHLAGGYEWVFSPHIGRANLWETSGHLDFYRDSMYAPMDIEGEPYYAKPMNCPFHIEIFKSRTRSYRDLPARYVEFGTVYRYERAGTLQGLTRVRGFTQDDAHIFCRPDQVAAEIDRTLEFSLAVLRAFGLTHFKAYLSTRPAKFVGDPAAWESATDSLRQAVVAHDIPYDVDDGGGAFYGPKIDLKVNDAIGREWQLSTIQFDFNLPERFTVEYIGEDGEPHRPYMVHRALLGSMERFLGVLIEHYAGSFPVWLAPVQALVIPIADRHLAYADRVAARARAAGLRVEVDRRAERMQAKVRDAQLQKLPYMLVVGDKEAAADAVSLRLRTNENLGAVPLADFLAVASRLNATRSQDLWPAKEDIAVTDHA